MDRQIQLFFIKYLFLYRLPHVSAYWGTSMTMYEKISNYIRTIISKNDRDLNLKRKNVGRTQAVYRQATRNSHREWQYHRLHVYNSILLKMSTWGSKHVEENNILRINNNQCIKLVINVYSLKCPYIFKIRKKICSQWARGADTVPA